MGRQVAGIRVNSRLALMKGSSRNGLRRSLLWCVGLKHLAGCGREFGAGMGESQRSRKEYFIGVGASGYTAESQALRGMIYGG